MHRVVAPYNSKPRWPRGDSEVLQDLKIAARQRLFYAHWARRFVQQVSPIGGNATRGENRRKIKRFLTRRGRMSPHAQRANDLYGPRPYPPRRARAEHQTLDTAHGHR